jgi:hypothetical protein
MKIKLTAPYLITFLSLLFVINELHNWSHSVIAGWICDCWGTQAFDKWTVCEHCEVDLNIIALAWFAGPFINYILIWVAWGLLYKKNSAAKKSIGFSLLFASVPFVRLFSVFSHGDEVSGAHQLFASPGDSYLFTIPVLIIVILLITSPLIRAFKMLGEAKNRILIFACFLILPALLIHFGINTGMNKLLEKKYFRDSQTTGVFGLVIVWGLFWLFMLLITFKYLSRLFGSQHYRHKRRRHRETEAES